MFFLIVEYESACDEKDAHLSDLLCVITGKGPFKEFYTSIINLKEWKHVTIIMPWLENEEYPKMLGLLKYYMIEKIILRSLKMKLIIFKI